MVAAIDGMRFVVPVPSLMAKPNRKHFGPKRGITFLNMINDQAFGTGHKIVAGTDRDCLNAIDLFFSPGAANLPEVLVTDTGSYSDLIFGIASLLGVDYRPALADLPDQKGWRPGDGADYGSLNTFARGKLDLGEGQRLQARTFTTGKTGARRRIRSRRCCGRVRSDLQLPVLELLPDGPAGRCSSVPGPRTRRGSS